MPYLPDRFHDILSFIAIKVEYSSRNSVGGYIQSSSTRLLTFVSALSCILYVWRRDKKRLFSSAGLSGTCFCCWRYKFHYLVKLEKLLREKEALHPLYSCNKRIVFSYHLSVLSVQSLLTCRRFVNCCCFESRRLLALERRSIFPFQKPVFQSSFGALLTSIERASTIDYPHSKHLMEWC